MTIICINKNEKKRDWCHPIKGDCLERAGLHIPRGGLAITRQGLEIRVGDLVHCGQVSGALNSQVKQVKEIKDGTYIVGTAYTDRARDFTFEAAEIYGVVTEVFDPLWHSRIYVREEIQT
jgi:hypothetical protein